jgi:hypothetical protein
MAAVHPEPWLRALITNNNNNNNSDDPGQRFCSATNSYVKNNLANLPIYWSL